jgi:hypothetical protein
MHPSHEFQINLILDRSEIVESDPESHQTNCFSFFCWPSLVSSRCQHGDGAFTTIPIRWEHKPALVHRAGRPEALRGRAFGMDQDSMEEHQTAPHDGAIVVVAKCPIGGKSKTRLIPLLGEDGSANLARCMLSDVLLTLDQCVSAADASSRYKF